MLRNLSRLVAPCPNFLKCRIILSFCWLKTFVSSSKNINFNKTLSDTLEALELSKDLSNSGRTCNVLDILLTFLILQVEDTLNNSNDLFLTFRKEMEEMSKKTKRLEKENLALTRKHDLTNRNILEMAEERTKFNKDMEVLRKRNNTLESVIRRMQDQGRAPTGAGAVALEADEEGTESDYEDDEFDEEEGSEDGEYDDDTEEEALQAQVGAHPTFGPAPPPPPSSQVQVNGKVNGEVNGVKPIVI